MDKFYLDTQALGEYLKKLDANKDDMSKIIDYGLKITTIEKYSFDDAVYNSACTHVNNIAENLKKMINTMDRMSEVAKKQHKAYTEYNVGVNINGK